METYNATQKSIKKMLKRYSMFSKELQYQKVAEDLKVTPRWVRYILSGEKNPSRSLVELIKILSKSF